jgi:hypothetical protein
MPTPLFFYGTVLAKITRTGAETEGLPGTAQKDSSLKVGDGRFYICIRLEVYQNCPGVSIQNLAHLLGCGRKGRADQALAVTIASKLALQTHPGSSHNIKR